MSIVGAGASGVVDLHNHLLPGVDDGARDEAEALAGLRALAAAGVQRLAVTPHFTASAVTNGAALSAWMDRVDGAYEALRALASSAYPELRIDRAAEVALDVPDPDLSDSRLGIAGGPFVLVEFPYVAVPPHSGRLLRRLSSGPVRPVLAHPERYQGFDDALALAQTWRDSGAVLQLNGPSLLGRYGKAVRRRAEALLAAGLVDYVASDYHARGDASIAAYTALLGRFGSPEQVTLLTSTNPQRIADGHAPIPVGRIAVRHGFWSRFSRRRLPHGTRP